VTGSQLLAPRAERREAQRRSPFARGEHGGDEQRFHAGELSERSLLERCAVPRAGEVDVVGQLVASGARGHAGFA
jgi:hypothetical protein